MCETIKERIHYFMDSQGLSVSGLAKNLGLNVNTLLGQMNGNVKVSMEFATSLLENYPDLSAEWLFRNDGEMLLEDHQQVPTMVEKELRARIAALIQLCEEKDQHLEDVRTLVGLKKTSIPGAVAAC